MGVSKWDAVDFSKNKVSNICIILFAAGIHGYLIFCKLAHVAFCKQTLQLLLTEKSKVMSVCRVHRYLVMGLRYLK